MANLFRLLSLLVIISVSSAVRAETHETCYRWNSSNRWTCTGGWNRSLAEHFAWEDCRRVHYYPVCKMMEWTTREVEQTRSQPTTQWAPPVTAASVATPSATAMIYLYLPKKAKIGVAAVSRLDGGTRPSDESDHGGEVAKANNTTLSLLTSGGGIAIEVVSVRNSQIVEDNQEETSLLTVEIKHDNVVGPLLIRTRDEDHANDLESALAGKRAIDCWLHKAIVMPKVQGEELATTLRPTALSCFPRE